MNLLHISATSRFFQTICLLLLFAALQSIGFGQDDVSELKPNQTITREMTDTQTHRYKFDVQSGEFFQVRVEQKGVDVALKILSEDGKTLAMMDSPNGKEGSETLSFVAERGGSYVLEISGFDEKAKAGNYTLKREASRTGNTADKKIVEAEKLFVEALNLFNQKTGETYKSSSPKFQEASHLFLQSDDKIRAGMSIYFAGLASNRFGDRPIALKLFEEALTLYRIFGDKSGEASILINIGFLHSSLGEKQKALEYLNQVLSLQRAIGNKVGETQTLKHISFLYNVLNNNQKALEYLNEALSLDKAIGNKVGESNTLNDIGLTYEQLGEKEKALKYFNQALLLYKAREDKFGEALTITNIARVYVSSGERQKALEYFNQALPLYKASGDKFGEADMLQIIGFAYSQLGEKQKALEYFSQALQIIKTVGNKDAEAETLSSIANVYSFLGKKQKALEYLNQALPLYKAVGNKENEAGTLSKIMQVWEAQKVSRLAVFYGKQSVNLYQELRTNIQGLDKETQKTYLKSIKSTYRKLADILINQGRIAEAEQVVAMLKEEEYLSYLRRDDAVAANLKGRISLSPDEKKAFADYEKYSDEITRTAEAFGDLEKKKINLSLDESLSADDQKQYDQLKAKYDAALTVFNKFLDELKVKFAQKGEQYKQVAAIESDTQGLLKKLNQPRTVIISTIVGEDRLNLIVTTSDIQKAHTVEVKAAELNKLVVEFRDAVKNSAVDPRPLGKKLYDKLFPAALQKDLENIKADTIVWSLDGTLRYVPMAALSPDGKRYLVEKYNQAVITLASRDKLESQANSNRQNWLAFGVGVSKQFEDFKELPAVPQELCSVVADAKKKEFCQTYGQKGVFNGLILRDEEFTLSSFQNSLGKTSIVHIASHFALKAGDYKDSYLLLGGGENRRFSLEDLRKISNLGNIELLTLSACNTAMTSGTNSSGVEVEGFGALAQNKGVKTVLATLWAVADDSTGKLMTEFYKILEENPQTGKAEALRQAQLNMIRGGYKTVGESTKRGVETFGEEQVKKQPKFETDEKAPHAHPFFWSPFVLSGNWK